jgi:hypothetical protein
MSGQSNHHCRPVVVWFKHLRPLDLSRGKACPDNTLRVHLFGRTHGVQTASIAVPDEMTAGSVVGHIEARRLEGRN